MTLTLNLKNGTPLPTAMEEHRPTRRINRTSSSAVTTDFKPNQNKKVKGAEL